ncbi:odorant Hypothetical protein protein [Nesidiocoris tenuis]|uniref:Uncharacterized protein n=1 Tax=Nesidiocoris tenuis TaxID=355587 RepID=A0ABN7BAL1_9HEMI|nr:odorant Hypothetical protein protein [Nesidiocoris tenuis]
MFGFTGTFFLMAAVCCVFPAMAKIDQAAAMRKAKECVAEVGWNEDELTEMMTKKTPPASPQSKCFLKCMLEKEEAFADGAINIVAVKAGLEEQIEDQGQRPKAQQIAEECNEKTKSGADPCEYAASYLLCMHSGFKEAGIDIPM